MQNVFSNFNFFFFFLFQVDLSNRGLKKEVFFMKIQSTINLQDVTDLILRNNEFDSFLDCSTNLENLRTLDLSQNHLQRFFFLCKDEYNLQALNVSHNRLEYIDDNALNDRMPKLKTLDLSWNKLSVVNETMLAHFKVTTSYFYKIPVKKMYYKRLTFFRFQNIFRQRTIQSMMGFMKTPFGI